MISLQLSTTLLFAFLSLFLFLTSPAICGLYNSLPLSASLHSLPQTFFFWLSRVEWGQGSEKRIPHNPSLLSQVALSLTARTFFYKHMCMHVQMV